MDRTDFLKRLVFLTFIPLFLGLIFLQLFSYPYFRRLSENNSIRTIYLDIPRGKILDRNGIVLAEDKLGFNLAFVPFDLKNPSQCAKILAPILHTETSALLEKLTEKFANPFEPRVLYHNLSQEQLHFVEENSNLLEGIYVQAGLVRTYPLGKDASILVGYLGEVTKEELLSMKKEGIRPGDLVGRAGIERLFDHLLRGERGGTQVEVDAHGHQLRILGQKASKPGHSIVLTIDSRLQRIAAQKLGERPGSVVAISPDSGEILALVSKPAYNPSDPAPYLSKANKPFLNRAIAGLYAPGSVFKIITSIAALETGAITPEEEYNCSGMMVFGDREFHCWKEEGHGWVSFKDAFAQSCNIYFGQIGVKTGAAALLEFARRAGLGTPTGIDLPGEKAGFIPAVEESGGALNLSIGQGALLVTPLQMASLVATVANGGNILRPEVVKEIISPEGTVVERFGPSLRGYFFISETTLSLLKEAMELVVTSGTGRAAQVPGIPVAGKTGTAQIAHRELELPTRGSFVCYAPAENPEIAMAVVLDAGASSEAAAIAGQILKEYFYPPEENNLSGTDTDQERNGSAKRTLLYEKRETL